MNERQAQLCEIYAHRGFHAKPEIPENSLPAFRRAIEAGFAVEFDVHLIADGTLVVFHDSRLERETGVKGEIEDCDLANLKKLRLEGTDEQIPTFDEVLDLFEESRTPLLIELKVARGNYRELVARVVERLDRYSGPYVIESFDPRAIIELRRLRPQIVRGQLSQNFLGDPEERPENMPAWQALVATNMWMNPLARPDFIAYHYPDRANKALRRAVDRRGVREAVWTVRKAADFVAARKAGCSVIFEKFDPREI